MEMFPGDPSESQLLHFKYHKWSDGKIMKNYGTKETRLGKAGLPRIIFSVIFIKKRSEKWISIFK